MEEELSGDQAGSYRSVALAEQLGDLYCKVGCYSKALEAYQAQVINLFKHTDPCAPIRFGRKGMYGRINAERTFFGS